MKNEMKEILDEIERENSALKEVVKQHIGRKQRTVIQVIKEKEELVRDTVNKKNSKVIYGLETAVVQWNHACFGVHGVSKRTGLNPVHDPSVGWASSFGATVS
ncbi:hypothetical protein E2C01_017764 [Portunus trituberculatus]|uniref:Uncharacterized protein n=1 Tax=Portunus trituberculatus TaxID=210409 RepID=A0A5B7DUE9_PORTR|nr:hypothetical protein [Portunus trituberculatus]